MLLLALTGCGAQFIELADDQNYTFSSTISAEVQVIKAYEDASVDWSGLNPDLMGKTMDPSTEVDELAVVRFNNLSVDEVLTAINADSLKQADVSGYVEYFPPDGETDADLSAFAFLGTPIVPADEIYPGATYMLNAATEDVVGYRMLAFFLAEEDEENTTIILATGSADLDYTVDLSSMSQLLLDNKRGNVTVDWTALESNGSGLDFKVSDIDQMMLARYDESLDGLEDEFLLIQDIAAEMYTGPIEGVGEYNFLDLVDDDGNSFSGFDSDGTWIMALLCGDCINPAPPFLGVISYD